jgi:hypothetical protein
VALLLGGCHVRVPLRLGGSGMPGDCLLAAFVEK